MRRKAMLLAALLFAVQVAAQQTGVKFRLEWDHNPVVEEVVAYGVYVADAQNGPYTLVTTVPENMTLPKPIWNVPEGDVYLGKFFRVSALNQFGMESDLSANSVRLPVKPSAPAGLQRFKI